MLIRRKTFSEKRRNVYNLSEAKLTFFALSGASTERWEFIKKTRK